MQKRSKKKLCEERITVKAEAVIKKKSERFIEAMAEKMRYENEKRTQRLTMSSTTPRDDLSAEDIYRVYMEEIAAIPPCSEAENKKLLGEIRNGNKAARERLIKGNLKNALFFVQDYINKGVPMADLIQGSQHGAHDAGG